MKKYTLAQHSAFGLLLVSAGACTATLSVTPAPVVTTDDSGTSDAGSDAAVTTDASVDPKSFFGADQGMWPFDRIPKESIKQNHPELVLDDAAIARMRNASVLLDNCSASFVSKDGLIMTNQHCARGTVGDLVTETFDPIKKGYFAGSLSEEKVFPNAPKARVIQAITDVTSTVTTGLAGLDEAARNLKISENTKALVDTCMTGLSEDTSSCEVTGRDGASAFMLYKYKVYKDVRFVGIAPAAGAQFASSVTPYNYPDHWHTDFAFYRAYEFEAPAATPNYFAWSAETLKDGDTVMVSGSPSATSRGWSMPAYDYVRKNRYADWASRQGAAVESLKTALAAATNEVDRVAIQISLASYIDQRDTSNDARNGMDRPEAVAIKTAMTEYVENMIAADPSKFSEFQGLFPKFRTDFAKLTTEVISRYRTMEGWQLSDGGNYAFYFVKLADQLQKPDADREEGYHEAQYDDWWKEYLSTGSDANKSVDAALWRAWLARLAVDFAADTDVTSVLAEQGTEARVASMLTSDLYTVAKRKALYDSIVATRGKAMNTTVDPALVFMKKLLPAEIRALKAFNDTSVNIGQGGNLATRAHAAVFGAMWPTESNADLRLSVGRVKRFSADGQPVQVATTFKTMFDFARANAGKAGYELPALWLANEASFSPTAQLVVATDTDTFKGNSGSPVLNAKGAVVGVHYGANPQQESRAYVYLNLQERSMVTSTQAMEEVLRVHGATALLGEVRSGGLGPQPTR